MPSFSYYATPEDSIEILRELCGLGFKIVVEPELFERPEAPVFDSVTPELKAILQDAPNHYLAGSFSRFPIQYFQITEGRPSPAYSINLLAGGPLMQAIVGRLQTIDGKPTLVPGDVSFQDKYRNPETNAWEKASPELKAAFRSAVSAIQRRCEPLSGKAAPWISPKAKELLDAGQARLLHHR